MSSALGLADDYSWRRESRLNELHAEAQHEHQERALVYSDFLSKGFVEGPTSAGVVVNQATAIQVSPWLNGITIIAQDTAALDRNLYRRNADGSRDRVNTHPAFKVVQVQPNPIMGPQVFWETMIGHAVGWGNAFAEIEFDNANRPLALWPIPPNEIEVRTAIFVDKSYVVTQLFYLWRGTVVIKPEDILHIHGLGFDGLRGYSPVTLARQALGLALATEKFGATFFGEGAWGGVALEHPGPQALSDVAWERLRETFNNRHKGADKAHRLMILEEGMKVSKPITIAPDDAQFLETRQFQIEEVARHLNINPSKLKHKSGARPGGNYEAEQLDHKGTTIMPWAKRVEQECNNKLILDAQRGSLYFDTVYDAILAVDAATRTEVQQAYFDMGVLTAKQIARQQNLPDPAPKPKVKLALAPPAPPQLDTPPVAPVVEGKNKPEPNPLDHHPPRSTDPVKLALAQRGLLEATIGRFVRREAENGRRAIKKGSKAFGDWVEEFYDIGEDTILRESLEPAVAVYLAATGSEADPTVIAGGFATGYMARSREQLLDLKTPELADAGTALLKSWERTRAAQAAEELIAVLSAAEEKENVA